MPEGENGQVDYSASQRMLEQARQRGYDKLARTKPLDIVIALLAAIAVTALVSYTHGRPCVDGTWFQGHHVCHAYGPYSAGRIGIIALIGCGGFGPLVYVSLRAARRRWFWR